MNIRVRKHQMVHVSIFLAFFSLGFSKSIILVPSAAVSLLICLIYGVALKVKLGYLAVFYLFFLIFFPLYFVGERLLMSSPHYYISIFIVVFLAFGYVFYEIGESYRIKAFICFSLGVFSEVMVVVSYSYFVGDSSVYGYGRVYNPFSGEVVNSPSWSLLLAISCFVFLYIFFNGQVKDKIFSFSMLVFAIFGGVFLGGRAFFILLLFSFLFFLYFYFTAKAVLGFCILLPLIIVAFFIVFDISESMYYQALIARFESGGSSGRVELWAEGIYKTMIHPFGGFQVDTSLRNDWYHNIWIDLASLSGYVPLLGFLFLNIFSIVMALSMKGGKHKVLFLGINLVCLLIMSQDVILEGNWRVLLAYYLSVCAIVSSFFSRKKDNESLAAEIKCNT